MIYYKINKFLESKTEMINKFNIILILLKYMISYKTIFKLKHKKRQKIFYSIKLTINKKNINKRNVFKFM